MTKPLYKHKVSNEVVRVQSVSPATGSAILSSETSPSAPFWVVTMEEFHEYYEGPLKESPANLTGVAAWLPKSNTAQGTLVHQQRLEPQKVVLACNCHYPYEHAKWCNTQPE